jgi:hypothetical protein
MIAADGLEKSEQAKGVVANMARDRRRYRPAEGARCRQCDVALSNTYYYAR